MENVLVKVCSALSYRKLTKVVYSAVNKPFKLAVKKARSSVVVPAESYPDTAVEMLEEAQSQTEEEEEKKKMEKEKKKHGLRRCLPRTPSAAIDFAAIIIFPSVLGALLVILFMKEESV